ncbi:MAG: urease accessory protein [Magnetococcales bacterium]|nr:urease accessory protein UreD [Magnetococcales bacterium]NGZ25462.1 urease accessory protein [Magnetococcales bacterium]
MGFGSVLQFNEGWQARLEVGLERREQRTVLAHRRHWGPLRLQKPFYPEDESVCHLILLHPPGGVVAGDGLQIEVHLKEKSHGLITTPGAGKWYGSTGAVARQQVTLHLETGAILEWLPQENTVYDGARVDWGLAVHLAPGATFVGMDMLCLGRQASGERFLQGKLVFANRIWDQHHPLWWEQGVVEGGAPCLAAPSGWAGYGISGHLVVAGPEVENDWRDLCRACTPPASVWGGVTALPRVLIVRGLSQESEALRHWLRQIWLELRPLVTGQPAQWPRIWNT